MYKNEDQGATGFEIFHDPVKKSTYLVDTIIPYGLVVVGARPKEGKSGLMEQMSIDIVQNNYFLNKFKTEQGSGLYISFEEDRSLIHERLNRFTTIDSGLHKLRFEFGWLPINEGGIELLQRYVEMNPDIKFGIIDTLSRFSGTNSRAGRGYRNEYEYAEKFQGTAKKLKIAIILIHHTIKNSSGEIKDLYGSSGFSGAADSILLFQNYKERRLGKLNVISRHGDACYTLKFNQDSRWEYMGDGEEIDVTRERADILEVLTEQYGPTKVNTIAVELKKKTSAISNLLKKMLNQGLVKNVAYGIYEITDIGRKFLINNL